MNGADFLRPREVKLRVKGNINGDTAGNYFCAGAQLISHFVGEALIDERGIEIQIYKSGRRQVNSHEIFSLEIYSFS